MKMKAFAVYRRIFSLLLCLCLFLGAGLSALADDGPAEGVLDADALQDMVDEFMAEQNISPENFSIGYVYSGTGEQWYHNPDTWYYPASMYKVPLMMLLAEKVYAGELTQDSDLGGYSVATAEEYIISYSNNDYAHNIRRYLGGDEVWRQEAKKFTTLEEGDYSPDYIDFCYFSPRYITEVVSTLYNEPERFPNIIECMLDARPTHDFRLSEHMNNTYNVAQKYGSYSDGQGDNWNHNTGIIYTPTPFILTVMTLNVPNYEKVISDAAVMFTEYTLSLEAELEELVEEQAQQAEEEAEAERIAAEEKAAAEKAEQERLEAEKAEKQRLEAEKQKKTELIKLAIAAALALLLVVLLTVLIKKRQKRKRYEEYQRRFRQEMEQRERQRRR